MPGNIPVEEALEMLRRGWSNEEISRNLEQKGYNSQQIIDAINQAKIKMGVEENMPPSGMTESYEDIPIPDNVQQQEPQKQQQNYYQPQYSQPEPVQMPAQQMPGYEQMQALIEEVVEEKWKEFTKGLGDLNVWKARVGDDLEATKQELLRTQRRVEELQIAVVGKVKEYNQSVLDINREMKALEQVFGKILEPLTENIKELKSVTEQLKKK